jgi:hypothetical protein
MFPVAMLYTRRQCEGNKLARVAEPTLHKNKRWCPLDSREGGVSSECIYLVLAFQKEQRSRSCTLTIKIVLLYEGRMANKSKYLSDFVIEGL